MGSEMCIRDRKWLEGGMKETPEEIAQLIATIVSSSALVTISR